MKRKLIQMAGKTMVVSLPSDVVRKYGLKKGQELEVTEDNGKISISIENQLYKEPCKLKIKENFIQEQLESIYTQGYNEIKIFYANKDTLKKIIQNINKRFIGFQVLDSNGQYCIVKSIATEDDTKLSSIIRRSFLILLSLLENDDEDNRENLIKLINICRRILHQRSCNLNEAIPLYNLTILIEEISKLNKIKKLAKELIEQIYNLYYKFDELKYIEIKDKIAEGFHKAKKDGDKILFLYNAEKMLDLVAIKNIRVKEIISE